MKNLIKKKGDLAVNTIVITILALVVLFILILIFSRQSINFRQGLNDCESKQGLCREKSYCEENKGQILSFKCDNTDSNTNNICCYLSCESQKGVCIPKSGCQTQGENNEKKTLNYILYTNCDDKGEICCFENK